MQIHFNARNLMGTFIGGIINTCDSSGLTVILFALVH